MENDLVWENPTFVILLVLEIEQYVKIWSIWIGIQNWWGKITLLYFSFMQLFLIVAWKQSGVEVVRGSKPVEMKNELE